MNTLVLLLMTGYTSAAGPGWTEVPDGQYPAWGGNAFQSAQPQEGRHGLFHHNRRGLFHRKGPGCNCAHKKGAPAGPGGMAGPGGYYYPGAAPAPMTFPVEAPGLAVAPIAPPAPPVVASPPVAQPAAPPVAISPPAPLPPGHPVVAAPATPPAPTQSLLIPPEPAGPDPSGKEAKPLPRGDASPAGVVRE